MIPIRDDTPRFTTPWVNYTIIVLNSLVFLYEATLPPRALLSLTKVFGVVPAVWTLWLHGQAPAVAAIVPVFTSMFLHGSWLHLIGNMWFLWIFGDNIEDHLGHGLYIFFYLIAGIAAALLQILFSMGSTVPSIGASGAIAGVLGAYFVLFPGGRVLTLVPFFFVYFLWLPAWVMLGYWFIVQFLGGAATSITYSQQSGGGQGGIAFWAHVGGFVAGVLMIKALPKKPRRYRYSAW
jgi:membrane associated rhomboid family serine protease